MGNQEGLCHSLRWESREAGSKAFSLIPDELDGPVQLEIQDRENSEEGLTVRSTWRATEARRVGKISVERDVENRFLAFLEGEEGRI